MRRLLFLLLLPLILAIPRAGHAQIAANCNTISGNIGCIGTITDGTNTAANVHKLIVSGGTIAPGAPGEATLTATGTGCPLTGCTYSGAINILGANALQIQGVTVVNTWTNSPAVVFWDTQNVEPTGSVYVPAPLSQGYTTSLSTPFSNIYQSMMTDQVTITGSNTAHFGEREEVIQIISGTQTGELNQTKYDVVNSLGATITSGENIELSTYNLGTWDYWDSLLIVPVNYTSGTLTQWVGISLAPTNYNTTVGSFPYWTAIQNNAPNYPGGGSHITAGYDQFIYNGDQNATITTLGHIGFRPSSPAVGVTCNGTGTATLVSRASDTQGYVTTNTGATACTLTFGVTFPFSTAPICGVVPMNAAATALTGYTPGASTWSWAMAAASAGVYWYWCAHTY